MKIFSTFTLDQRLCFCWSANKASKPEPVTVGKFLELINDPKVKADIERLATIPDDTEHHDLRSKIKGTFKCFCFCASEFSGERRCAETACANGLGLIDIDHMPVAPEAYYEQLGGDQGMKTCGVVLVHKSPSGKGMHLVFRLQPGETIATGQERLCRNMGIDLPIDPAVKNVAGLSFMFPAEFLLYLDEKALEYVGTSANGSTPAVVGTSASGSTTANGSTTTVESTPANGSMALVKCEPTALTTEVASTEPVIEEAEIIEELPEQPVGEERYNGVPIRMIADHVLSQIMSVTVEPSADEHNRHTTAISLASYMAPVCDYDVALLQRSMPDWGLPVDELHRICEHVCRGSVHKPLSAAVRRLVEKLKAELAVTQGLLAEKARHNAMPPMPDQLPKAMNLMLKAIPDFYRPQAALASLAWWGTLLTSLRYAPDGRSVESPTFLIYVLGHMASGKGFTAVIDRLLSTPLDRNDDKAAEAIRLWKDECEAAGNRRKPRRPHLVVRRAQANFTVPGLIQQIIDSREQHILMFSEESDEFRSSQEASSLLRKAFDNAKCGQTRVSAQSVSGSAKTYLNLCLCGTPSALRKMVNNAENGLASRFLFVQMQPALGVDYPEWKRLSTSDMRKLEQEVERLHQIGLEEVAMPVEQVDESEQAMASDLMQDTHHEVHIQMPRLEERIRELRLQWQNEYEQTHAVAPSIFAHRIPSIIRRAAMVMYAMEGRKETSRGIEFAVWVGQCALQSFLNLFGRQYDMDFCRDLQQSHEYERVGHNVTVLDQLPASFTSREVAALRSQMGLSASPGTIRTCLHRWKTNGDIVPDAEVMGVWHKVA